MIATRCCWPPERIYLGHVPEEHDRLIVHGEFRHFFISLRYTNQPPMNTARITITAMMGIMGRPMLFWAVILVAEIFTS